MIRVEIAFTDTETRQHMDADCLLPAIHNGILDIRKVKRMLFVERTYIMPSSQFFSSTEIKCNCGCGLAPADNMLTQYTLQVADSIREALGSPLRCLSGRRCQKHNKAVGGAEKSMHLQFAMDLQPTNPEHFNRLVVCGKNYYDCGLIDGLGLYPTFIHMDLRKMLFRARAKWGSKKLWEPTA